MILVFPLTVFTQMQHESSMQIGNLIIKFIYFLLFYINHIYLWSTNI